MTVQRVLAGEELRQYHLAVADAVAVLDRQGLNSSKLLRAFQRAKAHEITMDVPPTLSTGQGPRNPLGAGLIPHASGLAQDPGFPMVGTPMAPMVMGWGARGWGKDTAMWTVAGLMRLWGWPMRVVGS